MVADREAQAGNPVEAPQYDGWSSPPTCSHIGTRKWGPGQGAQGNKAKQDSRSIIPISGKCSGWGDAFVIAMVPHNVKRSAATVAPLLFTILLGVHR